MAVNLAARSSSRLFSLTKRTTSLLPSLPSGSLFPSSSGTRFLSSRPHLSPRKEKEKEKEEKEKRQLSAEDVKALLLPTSGFGKFVFASTGGVATWVLLHSPHLLGFSTFLSGLGGLGAYFAVRSWLRRNTEGPSLEVPFGIIGRLLNSVFTGLLPPKILMDIQLAAQSQIETNPQTRRVLCGVTGGGDADVVVLPPHESRVQNINGNEQVSATFHVTGLRARGVVVAEGQRIPGGPLRISRLTLTIEETFDGSGEHGRTFDLTSPTHHAREGGGDDGGAAAGADRDARGFGIRNGKKFVDADFREKKK